jgi:hypothetical protein
MPHTCCIAHPFHFSWFIHPNFIWWRVQIMQLFTRFSPLACYLVTRVVVVNFINILTPEDAPANALHDSKYDTRSSQSDRQPGVELFWWDTALEQQNARLWLVRGCWQQNLRFQRQCSLALLAKVVCRRQGAGKWKIMQGGLSCRGYKMNRFSFTLHFPVYVWRDAL